MPRISFEIDETSLKALTTYASQSGFDVGNLLREAVERDLYRRTRTRRAARSDEALIAPLRALLADDLNYARTWSDLEERLAAKGYVLREAGGGVSVVRLSDGARMAKASDLGTSYGRLMRRLGGPMPGHSHAHLHARFVTPSCGPSR